MDFSLKSDGFGTGGERRGRIEGDVYCTQNIEGCHKWINYSV